MSGGSDGRIPTEAAWMRKVQRTKNEKGVKRPNEERVATSILLICVFF